jgi:Cys-tRNA(Pro) deacylase
MRILDSHGIQYVVKQHSRPVFTVEEAALERGVRESQIVKAMVVKKGDGSFCLALVPGHRKLSLKKVRQTLDDSKAQLATREEVTKVTGYQVGAVTPVGIRRKNMPIFFEQSILEEEYVGISSGDPNAGIELRSSDLLSILNATLVDLLQGAQNWLQFRGADF